MNERNPSRKMFSWMIGLSLGAVIGFWGSALSFLSWLIAILIGVGWGAWGKEVSRHSTRDHLPMKVVAGIIIGGIPMWWVAASAFQSKWWVGILCSLITGTLLFSSAVLTRFYFFCRNFNFTRNNDPGQPPSNNNIFRRFLLTFKRKDDDSNGQPLQSAITQIA